MQLRSVLRASMTKTQPVDRWARDLAILVICVPSSTDAAGATRHRVTHTNLSPRAELARQVATGPAEVRVVRLAWNRVTADDRQGPVPPRSLDEHRRGQSREMPAGAAEVRVVRLAADRVATEL